MTIASMTGFGRAAGSSGATAWTVEIKSVNGRTLDARLRLPAGFERLELAIRQAAGNVCQRGNLQFAVGVERAVGAARLRIDETALDALYRQANAFAASRGLPPVGIAELLPLRGIIVEDEGDGTSTDDEALDAAILASAGDALAMLAESRQREGAALSLVLEGQLATMEARVADAGAARDAQADVLRQRLWQQVEQLSAGTERLEPQRLHQEAILLATRADIREEIDRLVAHVVAARDLLRGGGAVGRRLDFLAQEMGRETNTICSKASHLALTEIGLDLKSVVEQFREQVQNVE